jgi:hypothetical protein
MTRYVLSIFLVSRATSIFSEVHVTECLLISETSSEQRNDFLDRALVGTTIARSGSAFFET